MESHDEKKKELSSEFYEEAIKRCIPNQQFVNLLRDLSSKPLFYLYANKEGVNINISLRISKNFPVENLELLGIFGNGELYCEKNEAEYIRLIKAYPSGSEYKKQLYAIKMIDFVLEEYDTICREIDFIEKNKEDK